MKAKAEPFPHPDPTTRFQSDPGHNWLLPTAFALSLVWSILFMCTDLWEFDIWWHLKSGETIVTQGTIPRQALFDYPYHDRAWIDLHWLYEVGQYLLYQAGGVSLLVISHSLCITIAMVLAVWPCIRRRQWLRAGSLLLLASFILNRRAIVRPEAYSYIFLMLYFLLLEAYRRAELSGRRWLYCLPVPLLQIGWTNTQALSILGLGLIGIAIVDEAITQLGKRAGGRCTPLMAVGIMAAVATLANPYGLRGALFPLHLLGVIGGSTPVWKAEITEFAPLVASLPLWPWPPLVAIVLLICAVPWHLLSERSQAAPRHWLLYAIFLVLSLMAVRNVALFCLLGMAMLAQRDHLWLRGMQDMAEPWRNRIAQRGAIALIALLLLLGGLLVTHRYYPLTDDGRHFGFGVQEHHYPSRAVDYLVANKLMGNLFHDLNDGGYLIWRLYPEYRVFIDTRIDPVIMDVNHFKRYLRMCHDRLYFDQMAEQYEIRVAIIRPRSAHQFDMFTQVFENNPRWEPVFFDSDESSLLLIRRK